MSTEQGSRGANELRLAFRAGIISIVAGVVITLVKFLAWSLTGSTAVLSDAAESLVNVAAASMATWSVVVAARPADADHPYGHGKAENISAAVEGLMIAAAASLIFVEAARALVVGPELERLGFGIVLSVATAGANLVLGLYLIRIGRRAGSTAIEADGQHVMTDVITTAGTIVALIAVKLTGLAWIDPLAALAVAANIVRIGWRIIRSALGGLLDEADFEMLEQLSAALERGRQPEWVGVHELRSWFSGSFRHFDLHLSVPRYLSVEQAHRIGDQLENTILEQVGGGGDVVVHLDPCEARQCGSCTLEDCPVRASPLREPFRFGVEAITRKGLV